MIHHIRISTNCKFSEKSFHKYDTETNLRNVCITGDKIIFSDRYELDIIKLDEPVPFTALIPIKFFNSACNINHKKNYNYIDIDTELKTCSYKNFTSGYTLTTELKYYSDLETETKLPEPFNVVKNLIQNLKNDADNLVTLSFDATILFNLITNLITDTDRKLNISFNPDAPNKPIYVKSAGNSIDAFGVLMPIRNKEYKKGEIADDIVNVFSGLD